MYIYHDDVGLCKEFRDYMLTIAVALLSLGGCLLICKSRLRRPALSDNDKTD